MLFAAFLFINETVEAQIKANVISTYSYKNITYNGKTIQQIEATEGNPASIVNLLGQYSSFVEAEDSDRKTFLFGENRIGYSEDFASGVSRLTVNDNSWPVVIMGKMVRVGDSEASLREKFGPNIKMVNDIF